MAINVGRILIGKPLETKELPHQAINRPIGLAVFASDALSSSAYATEEILIILALAGGGAAIFAHSIPIAIAISILLAIVTLSYRQTIYAYPNGGGAYIVARDNLGEAPAQVAGAALLTDYILTVAVSISAGVAQITSAFPDLLQYRVHIAVGVIIMMTIVNLRGVKESGRIFAVPTYFFLSVMFLTLSIGAYRYLTGTLPEIDPATVKSVHFGTTGVLTLFLLLRAFSSGCTALTGIEAISNGITAFKQPRSHNAAVTLIWMSSILIILFVGITLLAHQIAAIPSEEETIISQIGRAVYGDNSILHLLTLAGTALILLMAANTSYADFPRLAALHAGDGFLPRQLTFRGSRLVFSWGIMALAVCASLLVIVFNARTTALIPLYAVGVFLSFTVSQAGMVVRMRKISKLKPGEVVKGMETELVYDPHWRRKMFVSALGSVCTGVVMVVFAVTKFMHGAWFIVMLIPILVLIFFRIHHHYKRVAAELSAENAQPLMQRSIQSVILVDNVHAETIRLVNFARSMGHPWHAIHVATNPERVDEVLMKWQERIGEGELKLIDSPYRLLAEPVQEYIEGLLAKYPDTFIHVIMGHLQMETFWEQILHQNSALIFNLALSRLDRVIVTQVPYQIHHHEDVPTAANVEPATTLAYAKVETGEVQ
ncbi:MAG: permease [Chloroflexi bacterium]|nr:permease [Chloroflexota bacterium]